MLKIIEYSTEYDNIWDDFVLNHSINGTFLQTMNFLKYHPVDRFIDKSFMVFDDNRIVAVVPGCLADDGKACFFSHKGTSYGGIILSSEIYSSEKLINVIMFIDDYLSNHFSSVVFKLTPDLFCGENTDLLQYVLQYSGYSQYTELSSYVDLISCPEDVTRNFDRNKNRNIRRCIEMGLKFRELKTISEISIFHDLLTINLSKYNLKPVHTVEELIDLKYNREFDNIKFFGVFNNGDIVAAGMMFDFKGIVFHAQNLSYDYHIHEYSPITYLYFKVIEYAKKNNYKYLSWGVSTEDKGKVLNFGLIRNKESYGSKYQVNRTYYKDY